MRLAAGLAVALLLASGSGRALELALDPTGLDPAAQQRARDLFARVRERLPERWQADPRRLTLRFDPRLPADIAGRHRRGQLRLSPELLEVAATAAAHDLARATVLHEIAHAFDRGEGGGWSRQAAFRRLAGWDRRGCQPVHAAQPGWLRAAQPGRGIRGQPGVVPARPAVPLPAAGAGGVVPAAAGAGAGAGDGLRH
ncbi:hypothetical protein [Stenotrophomonas acidaminiphila]|uniref:DUF7844 domain-containing protein n=1 Tax=Stenotrophomonas acidaminiphila TaxID=128780 RepID=UPI001E49721E|nr:hypothetical protein [Stenotrophomonas acidaminiphila]